MERFKGGISKVLTSSHLRNREELEATLERYRRLYNGQIPWKNRGARTPVEVFNAHYESNPDRFLRKPHKPTSQDSYEKAPILLASN